MRMRCRVTIPIAYSWEFYYCGSTAERIGGWGWRKWDADHLEAQSKQRFRNFKEAERDAKRFGFDGPL
jgi:hypothetical protein